MKKKEEDFIPLKLEKSYDKIFKLLGNKFPAWCNWELLKDKFDFIFEADLIKLSKEGFIEMQESQKTEQTGPEDYEPIFDSKGYPAMENLFRLSQKGFEYLNNLNMKEMNKNMLSLNKILLLLTIGLLVIGVAQLLIAAIIPYLK